MKNIHQGMLMKMQYKITIILTIMLLISSSSRAFGVDLEKRIGFIHLRGQIVNSTCAFYINERGGMISLQSKNGYNSFFVYFSECEPAVYNNLELDVSWHKLSGKEWVPDVYDKVTTLSGGLDKIAALYNKNLLIPLRSPPVKIMKEFTHQHQVVKVAVRLPRVFDIQYRAGTSTPVTLRLMYP